MIHQTNTGNKKPSANESGKKVYHVKLGDDIHSYFGSISAIFDKFTPEQLGVSLSRLWQVDITPERPYRNKICTIYRGEIQRKKGNRKNSRV